MAIPVDQLLSILRLLPILWFLAISLLVASFQIPVLMEDGLVALFGILATTVRAFKP